ncbi:MAG: guanylate kinase [Clostridia bacterium]|nr:guanylate kinase [Clostridia bacterium]
MNKGQLIVVSGPSGCGKDTLITAILERMGEEAFLSVSMTTRNMRGDEVDGVDYFFVSPEEFEENIKNGQMLEYAKYGNNYYGTPLGPIEKLIETGKTVFLNIEVQGGASVKKIYPQAQKIFLVPPSLEVLEKRLTARGTDSVQEVETRLKIAIDELRRAEEYDYIVVNDVLEDAINDIMSIIRANQLKTDNMKNIISEVVNNA